MDWKLCNKAGFPTKYDKIIRRAVIKHWPLEWQVYHCYWRAQLAKESSLNPKHCDRANHAGAKCLAQLLPGTAKDIERATGLTATRSKVTAAIFGGAWYMAWQAKGWRSERTPLCRLELAQAGYISGRGHIVKAQRLARQKGKAAVCFDEIQTELHNVITPNNARDTINYVNRIKNLAQRMRTGPY